MRTKRNSVLGSLGWGLAADALLLVLVLFLMSLFAFSSISKAYLVAFVLLVVGIAAFVLWKKSRMKA